MVASHTFPPVAKCIYCGVDSTLGGRKLNNEHIIPCGLGGRLVLPAASCSDCAAITSKHEKYCIDRLVGRTKSRLGVRGREQIKSPDKATAYFMNEAGESVRATFPIQEHPSYIVMSTAGLVPEILLKISPSSEGKSGNILRPFDPETISAALHRAKGSSPYLLVTPRGVKAMPFFHMYAKIAHSYAVAVLGLDGFRPFLTDFIREIPPFYPTHYISSALWEAEAPGQELHEIDEPYFENYDNHRYVLVRFRLLGKFGMPSHTVVVGEA